MMRLIEKMLFSNAGSQFFDLAQYFNIEVMKPTFFLVARSATADPWLCKRNNKVGVHVNSLSMQRDRAENEKV